VMVPIRLAIGSVNHMLPSGPLIMPPVCAFCGESHSVYEPDGIILPIPCCLVYQTLPSGPGVIATGPMLVMPVLYSEILAPVTVMAPFALGPVFWCKNQTRPSGPEEIPPGLDDMAALTFGMGYSSKVTSGPFTLITGALMTRAGVPPEPELLGVPAVPPPLLLPAAPELAGPPTDPPLPSLPALPPLVRPPLLPPTVTTPPSAPAIRPPGEQAPNPAANANGRHATPDARTFMPAIL
jgi:hypothetical protein